MAIATRGHPESGKLGYQILGGAVILGVWYFAAANDLIEDAFLPLPNEVLSRGRELWSDGLSRDLVSTAKALITALFITLAVGVPMGTVLGLLPRLHRGLSLLLGLLLSIPVVAYLAISILWFEFGFRSVVAIGVGVGAVHLVMSTSLAVQGVDKVLKDVGRSYCGSHLQTFRKIILPGALPTLVAGVQMAGGLVIVGVVVGELFLSNEGLGAGLLIAVNFFDVAGFFAYVFCVAAIAHTVMVVLSLARRVVVRHER